MSQCTTFVINEGKEEIKVFWDLTNGEIAISREKLPTLDGSLEAEHNCSSKECECEKHNKHTFYFRSKDLSAKESMELAQVIQRAFFMLLGLKSKEEIREALGSVAFAEDSDDEEDYDED